MTARQVAIAVTTDAAGAGTALSEPVSGVVLEVRLPAAAAALTAGGSADFTLTRLADGGTVLAVTNQSAPWQFAPRQTEHTPGGGSIGADGLIPVDDHVRLVVAQAAPGASGTVYLTVGAGLGL